MGADAATVATVITTMATTTTTSTLGLLPAFVVGVSPAALLPFVVLLLLLFRAVGLARGRGGVAAMPMRHARRSSCHGRLVVLLLLYCIRSVARLVRPY